MATLINGNGNPRIYAAQDADLIASLAGDVTGIAQVGNQFAATALDANTITVADGVIVTKEGRRIQLDAGSTDSFTIPTGTAGQTNYYIIGYKLSVQLDNSQKCETFVQLMSSSTETIPEDTFRNGATEVYVSLYRVEQDGINMGTITELLEVLNSISQLNNELTANSQKFEAAYEGGKYGFTIDNQFYELGGGGGMPTLDYTTPLHTFSTNNLTYTATDECYLFGALSFTPCLLKINNIEYGTSYSVGYSQVGVAYAASNPFMCKIKSGDTVTVTAACPQLHVLRTA